MKFEKLFRRYNEDNGFNHHCGFICVHVEEGFAEVDLPIRPECLNPRQTVHGGLLYALVDTAAGVAANSHGVSCVTLSGNFNYLLPGTGTKLRAVAREVRRGRTTGVYDVEIFDDAQKLVAKGSYTMYFTGEKIDVD